MRMVQRMKQSFGNYTNLPAKDSLFLMFDAIRLAFVGNVHLPHSYWMEKGV
jgi:hypothetical protein